MKSLTLFLLAFFFVHDVNANSDPGDLSDYSVQPGSLSLSNAVLRNRPNQTNLILQPATPRPELTFRIQQLGSGGSQTRVPYSLSFRNNQTNTVYTTTHVGAIVNATTNSTALVNHLIFPSSAMPFGTYTLTLTLDRNLAICDRNRSNNVIPVTTNLSFVPTPDFVTNEPRIEAPGDHVFDAGEALPISVSVFNSHEPLPNPTSVRVDFYLTQYPYLLSNNRPPSYYQIINDPELRYLGWNMIQSGAGRVTTNFTLPADLGLLEYQIAAIPNSDLAIPEHSIHREDVVSNFETFTVRYVYERPEFDVSNDATITPTTLSTGQDVRFQSAVINSTEFATGQDILIHHYLVSTASSFIRFPLGTSSVEAIAGAPVGGSRSRSYDVTFAVPESVPTGTYRYLRIADELNLIPERLLETNTSSQGPIMTIIAPPAPDLSPLPESYSPTLSATEAQPGDSLTIEAEILNTTLNLTSIEPATAGPFEVEFFLSPISGNTQTSLGTSSSSGNTPVGGTTSISHTFTLPSLPPGRYWFSHTIDPLGQILERSELNNFSGNSAIFTILPPTPLLPDLVTDKITLPDTEASYEDFIDIEITVRNDGAGDAAGSNLRISLVPDLQSTGNEIATLLVPVPAIDSGKSQTVSTNFELPELTAGSLIGTFIWKIEVGIGVDESDETNNIETAAPPTLRLGAEEFDALPIIQWGGLGSNRPVCPPADRVSTSALLVNNGPLAASQVQISVYLTAQPGQVTASDLRLKTFPAFDLAGDGGKEQLLATIEIPENIPTGAYHLTWTADPENLIPRQNDQESLTISIPIQIRPLELRLEFLNREEQTVTLLLHDTDPKKIYQIESADRFEKIGSNVTDPQPGRSDNPLLFQFQLPDDEELWQKYFFRALETEDN